MSFTVRTETFEGPFDLLLHLILKDDVDLYEVRLCEIVDEYLVEMSAIDTCDLEISTEFLLIAATLVELKCRRLLPVDDDFDLDEELALWEERDLLLARLLECKTFKDAALVLHELMADTGRSVPRQLGLEEPFLALTPDPLAGMTAQRLRRTFLRLVSEKPVPELSLRHISVARASVTAAIEEFVAVLPGRGPTTFRELTEGIQERIDVVVRFLAVLELFKQGLVEIEQAVCFGDLVVAWAADAPLLDRSDLAQMAVTGADVYDG